METNIRFFTVAFSNGDLDIFEITESQFLEIEGTISYERHTVFQNGVNQVSLTIEPEEWPNVRDLDIIK